MNSTSLQDIIAICKNQFYFYTFATDNLKIKIPFAITSKGIKQNKFNQRNSNLTSENYKTLLKDSNGDTWVAQLVNLCLWLRS